ncbi:TniQ family protein [Mitsuaria sp. WAJ17]|uniref:TniQ family protein n=1 Tax=Mitsuaria sp. WAJ17 TaxID=2761452 RepID=UPI0016027076|nr:TniQ family protein [Mitsuaria sp. WAJ17]MBB2486988.1 TniQ family protein [Mitsuaria sp. WAJ17]
MWMDRCKMPPEDATVRPLLRTPTPYPTESLLGHVLRVSEENGYDSPWHVLSLAGIAQGEMRTAGFPVRKLAAVTGRSPSEYAHIAYQDLNKAAGYRLLGHALGSSLVSQPLRLSRPALCPDCVNESGHVDAFWDLSLAVACPSHGRLAISACPHCDAKLTWFRPGLLQCKCGGDLLDAAPTLAEPALQELMQVMCANLHRRLPSTPMLKSMPTQALLALPFQSLLALVRQLGRFTLGASGGLRAVSDADLALAAASTLCEWPSRFHQLLRVVDASQQARDRSTTLRKRYESFYDALFKGRDDYSFLEAEFIRFGTMEWGDGIVDRRMLGGLPVERRYMSLNELSQRTGVDPRTLSKWARSGRLSIKEISTGKQKRYIADASELAPPLIAEGRMMGARCAARFVELPVSALAALKASGHYASRHSPAMKPGYHEADLEAFKIQLLTTTPVAEVDPEVQRDEQVSLAYVMQEIRFWAGDGKGRFVAAYLDGKVKSVGRAGEGVGGILFKRTDVEAFAKRCRTDASGEAVSIQEAAQSIGCPVAAVPGLVHQGLLEAVQGANRTRIPRGSINAFLERFSALLSIAKDLGTTTARLQRICRSSDISTLRVPTTAECATFFVSRSMVDAVRAAWTAIRTKPKRPAVDVLETYLQSLRQAGVPLPRKGMVPNKSAIAMACGIDRSALASGKDAGVLLAAFALDEAGSFDGRQPR